MMNIVLKKINLIIFINYFIPFNFLKKNFIQISFQIIYFIFPNFNNLFVNILNKQIINLKFVINIYLLIII